MKKLIVGLTGASGSILCQMTVDTLLKEGHEVHFVPTPMGRQVLSYELEVNYDTWVNQLKGRYSHFHAYSADDLFAKIASGSFETDGMLIVPCSMGTLAKIAAGISDTLLTRAADVCLKEDRPLLLAVRETPLSKIHLENMLTVKNAGAVVFPPLIAYYHRPKTLEDATAQTVARMLKKIDVHVEDYQAWGEAKHAE